MPANLVISIKVLPNEENFLVDFVADNPNDLIEIHRHRTVVSGKISTPGVSLTRV